MRDVIVIGGGPGGLATAIYTSRSGRDTLVLERQMPGGLVANTDLIENYPGLPGIKGLELAERFRTHAEEFGSELIIEEVERIESQDGSFLVFTDRGQYEGQAVVVASGSAPRKLGVPGEEKFWGRGVSYCATCDGAFFRDQSIAVVGGGDAAVQEALFLTRFARKVTLIHRRDRLRAVDALRRRLAQNEKIEVLWNSVVESIDGAERVESLSLTNVRSGQGLVLPVSGLFIYIGHKPATEFLPDEVVLDEEGYIETDQELRTSVQGMFAVGDVRRRIQRQVATAVGDGATAAMAVELYLAGRE